ncbi:hypothetical protein HMPREF1317_1701 [Schaalia georgiae F0490]|uniref:Uncharacterized protein n=1 Tax=Schaalia georgiae F0490 TaxID=1125717 RepID=J1I0F2_9ACTO|nr:hypothetical protein [Schaalia georgiae]EJF51723.1 hypothetical protein HMPREF1317_1701 [Schaalia georgiae F0490]
MNAITSQTPDDPTPQPISWLTPAVRRYIYNVTIAALGVALVYGVVDGQHAAAWEALALAVVGLARAHVPGDPQ